MPPIYLESHCLQQVLQRVLTIQSFLVTAVGTRVVGFVEDIY